MGKYGITIRHADMSDKQRILNFLESHWKKDHIFVLSNELFEYYHVIDGKLTFILAEDDVTKEIYGLQGYIASNHTATPDVWGAIWKTIPCPYPFLGVEIMRFVRESTNARIFAGCGANPKTTIPLLKFLKEYTGKLNHYYRLNDKNDYHISCINNKFIPELRTTVQHELIKFETIDELISRFDIEKYRSRKPYKDIWYLNRRYFEHPTYNYLVYGIENGGIVDSILIAREQHVGEHKVLRLLDFIGIDNDLTGIGRWLDRMLKENGYEYVDFYSKGLPHEVLELAGFVLRNEHDANIIPNYFEPFVQANIDVYYNTNDDEDFYVFKADSDQDRPSLLAKGRG